MMRFKNSIAPKKMFQFETLKKSIRNNREAA